MYDENAGKKNVNRIFGIFLLFWLSEEIAFIPVVMLRPDLDCQLIRNREEVALFSDSSYYQ